MPGMFDGLRPHHQIALMLTLPAMTMKTDEFNNYLDVMAQLLDVPRSTFDEVFSEAWKFISTDFRGSYKHWEKQKGKDGE